MFGGGGGLAQSVGESHSLTWGPDTVKQGACRLALRHPAANRSELLWTAAGTNTLRLGETLLRAKMAGDFSALLARILLGPAALNSDAVQGCRDGDMVRVAGRVVRRQRPLAKAVFLTLEYEWGLIPIAVWEGRWERLKHALRRPLVVIEGIVSRRDNTLNVMAERAWPLSVSFDDRHRRQDWQ